MQPHSGANANMAVYLALLEPGDTVLGPAASTTAATSPTARRSTPAACSTTSCPTASRPSDERIDFDQVRDLALEHRPKMIVAGTTAYPRQHRPRAVPGDRRRGRRAVHVRRRPHRRPDRRRRPPEPGAATPTSSRSRRTRRCAARAAAASCRTAEHAAAIDKAVFPGLAGRPARARDRRQGGGVPRGAAPELHASTPHQIVRNAAALAEALAGEGFRLVSGGTDNHLMLVDLRTVRRRPHRQGGPGRARPGRHHAEQEHRSPTTRAARSSRAACASARRRSRPRA